MKSPSSRATLTPTKDFFESLLNCHNGKKSISERFSEMLTYRRNRKYQVLETIRKGNRTLFGRCPNLVISSRVAQFLLNCGLSLCNCTLMAEFGI